jgi:hypothetical protein
MGEQGLFADDFFYFLLRLRKARIRAVVDRVRRMYPDETPEQHARRLVGSTAALSLAAGGIVQLPTFVPVFGLAYEGLGFVAGASMLTRMHLYLILEIAMLFGNSIDHPDRVRELTAVVAGCSVSAAMPAVVLATTFNPVFAVAAGALTATVTSRAIGEAAIRRYKRSMPPQPAAIPVPAVG